VSELDPAQLLADAAWLQRLARSLADSEADADDLVQQTWIAAWRRGPATDRSLRPWLAKVARDLANMRRRGERRRAAREQVPELEPTTPPDALLETMRLHRVLVDLVLGLAEPYRSAVIWRYVEGRSAASIARSLGIPEATVRGRLREALARLRAGLDASTGNRKAWAPMVLAAAQNGVIVTKSTKTFAVLLAVLLLSILAIVIVPRISRESSAPIAATEPSRGATGNARFHAGELSEPPSPAWFAASGVASRRIAGRVTFAGRPVAGAIVALHSQLTAAGLHAPAQRTTGSDGGFDFGPRPAAEYQVTAEAPDRVPVIAHVDAADPASAPPPDKLELVLYACGAALVGTIYDASGGVIAGARVRRDGLAGASTDERGAYRLCLRRGPNEVEIGADGYGAVVLGIDIQGEQRRDVVLVPEGAISVRVVRGDDATPVAGAAVFAGPAEWGRDRPQQGRAVTGGDGRARIAGLVPGPYRVYGFADGMQASSPASAVAEVGTATEVVLRMDSTARISGTVVANGKPVADASVVAIRGSPLARSQPGYTRGDGAFALERVALGEITFSVFPYRLKQPVTVTVDAARTYAGIVLEVEQLGTIRGRVTRLGAPVEGVEVCCVHRDSRPPREHTGPDGRYEFRGVPEGVHQLAAGSDDIGAFTLGTKVTLGRGQHAVVDLELDQAAAIAGTVVDKQGEPVPGVFVRWLHEATGDIGRCATDPDGRYRCGAMTGGGTYNAAVYPAGSWMTPYPTADGEPYPQREVRDGATVIEGVTIAIDHRRLSIAGRVVDTTGAPIADAEVRALAVAEGQPPRFHSWQRLPSTFTSVDGTFAIAELAPGSYALQARSADGGEAIVANLAAGARGVTIAVERPGEIAGTLAGFSAEPVVSARLLGDSVRLVPAVVDGTRGFRISGLRPGRYLVGAQTASEGDARIAEVRAGRTTQLALTARGRGAIEGTVLDFRTRAPIANAACHSAMALDGQQATTAWDPASAARSDASGRFVIDPAPAGSITITCAVPSFRWSHAAADVVLAAGARATLRLFSVELQAENGGSAGIAFDWHVTAPRIARIEATSPARQAGLVVGDMVTAVDGVSVTGLNGTGVAFLIESKPVGSELTITVARGKTVTFVLPPHAN
jgi:RNA polymerase sigma-70 factor, ECF subfamily